MHPILYTIPIIKIPIYTYGFTIVIGYFITLYIATSQAKKIHCYTNKFIDLAFFILIFGILGARILFIIVEWKYFFITNPFIKIKYLNIFIPRIFAVWQGGIVFWGSFIGGFIAFYFYTNKYHWPKMQTADIIILGVPLGHAIGRIGCIAAGCCFGKKLYYINDMGNIIKYSLFEITYPKQSIAYNSLILSSNIQIKKIMQETEKTLPLFPSQLTEAFIVILIFFILLIFHKYKKFNGQITLIYIILYSTVRFILEYYRGDSTRGFLIPNVLTTSQFIAITMFFTSIIILCKQQYKYKINS